MINDEGRGAIGGDPEGKDFPWTPKPLNPLIGQTAGKINSSATLVYFTGTSFFDFLRNQPSFPLNMS